MNAQLATDTNHAPQLPAATVRHQIRFVAQASDGETVLMEFADPRPVKAVRMEPSSTRAIAGSIADAQGAMDILAVPGQPSDDPRILENMTKWVMECHKPGMALPVTITLHGSQVVWHAARAAILAAPERMDTLLLALVDFGFYERELGKLERLTSESWPQLETDMRLAFEVTSKDLERSKKVGEQVRRMLGVRMGISRIWPRLYRPATHLSSHANQLGERLRERTFIEDRLEFLDDQVEVFERVHEMSSQRFSETRSAKRELTMEWVIVVLLVAETILLLSEVLMSLERV